MTTQMQYREDFRSGGQLSVLGFGCMRLPRTAGRIDLDKTEALVRRAVEAGVNYFDTAYVYPGSEEAVGTVLARTGLRDQINLATKLPHQRCRSTEDFERIFTEELERLQTDHIDFYLIHNLSTPARWERVVALGIKNWIAEKKASGQVRRIGFSFHGTLGDFEAILDAYDWDFCQIQYNYSDENYQAGVTGLRKAHSLGLPVIIMEPLLGGKLALSLPEAARALQAKVHPDWSPARWGFSWVWNQPEPTVVLSGMNAVEQLTDNLEAAAAAAPGMLGDTDEQTLDAVRKVFREAYKVPCTGCNYCMPCPHGVNIPGCFAGYNASYVNGLMEGFKTYYMSTTVDEDGKRSSARACQSCGVCETKCPQHIAIPHELKQVRKRLEPFWARPVLSVVRKFM
ncbi:MAG: aldo/keto reductase [Coriobacteriia bacterium]|nr:aldo/keto reductase [Coriobacteriia bacterium]